MEKQTHVTLYTLIGKFERVRVALAGHFENMSEGVTDSSVENDVEHFVIRLKDGSEIAVHVNYGTAFIGQQIPGMCNFFAQVPCENVALQQGVLQQIKAFNCVVGCSFELDDNEDRTNYIINTLLGAANDINALVLMPDMRLFTSEGRLLFSTDGSSEFEEYTPIGNADVMDRSSEEEADIARRERSVAVLKKKKIPYFPQLRAAVSEAEAVLRTPEEIARRLLAMFAVCVYCEVRGGGQAPEETWKYLEKIDAILGGGLDAALSPEEKLFLAADMRGDDLSPEDRALLPESVGQRDFAKFGWRYECCHLLMWALGFVDELGFPDGMCDVSALGGIIWRQEDVGAFLAAAAPRPREELLDMADLVLRYDWACVDARVKRQTPAAKLDGEVVMEWHYAFNWLIGWGDSAEWDDIRTDT